MNVTNHYYIRVSKMKKVMKQYQKKNKNNNNKRKKHQLMKLKILKYNNVISNNVYFRNNRVSKLFLIIMSQNKHKMT